jgi:hypothetical protein
MIELIGEALFLALAFSAFFWLGFDWDNDDD